MNIFFVIFFSFVVSVCSTLPSLECNILGPKSPSLRLKRHLFCEYDSAIRPVTDKNKAINVTVTIAPQFMDFIDQTSSFIVHSWVFINWRDEHLTWRPEDFDGVEKIRVKSDEIWVPDLSVYNSGDMELSQTGVPDTICKLMFTGSVSCVPTMKYTTQCETDYTYWPYDKQKCTIRLGSWTHTGEEINVNFRKKSVTMDNYVPNKQWSVSNYTSRRNNPKYNCCPNDTFPTLIVDFYLDRHSPINHAVFITPAVVLMVITLTVLWLDSRSIERISLAAVNFICHMLCIYNLHWMLPSNGPSTPHILLFYRDSIILATFAMIITAFLRKLQSSKVAAPGWIVSMITFVTSNRAGRFFLLNESEGREAGHSESHDVEDTVEANSVEISSKTKNSDDSWTKLAVIIEWLSFFATVVTYALLVILLIPNSRTKYKTELK